MRFWQMIDESLSKSGSKGAETRQVFRETSHRFNCKCTAVRPAPCSLSLDAGHIAQEELFPDVVKPILAFASRVIQ